MDYKNEISNRLTYFSPTSFRIFTDVYHILKKDALRFGFRKNNRANISGFLNVLLPTLAHLRSEVYDDIKNLISDSTTISEIENLFYSIPTTSSSVFDPLFVTVPFRVNKEHYEDFLYIHDVLLSKFNLDFSEFIRNILTDYTSKRLAIRERLFFYKHIKTLYSAIENTQVCRIYTKDNCIFQFLPATISISPYTEKNIILGLDRSKKCALSLALTNVKSITLQNTTTNFVPEEINALKIVLNKFIAQEKKEQK